MQTKLTQTKLTGVLAAMMLAGLASPHLALAKGCTKGAVVGGVAGHEVGSGHGAAGAAAGCAVGHHEAKKKEKERKGDGRRSGTRALQQDRPLPPVGRAAAEQRQRQ